MDSRRAMQLYAQHANAMAYVDVEKPDGTRSIGSAFHIGEGIFVTARHVVENNRIVEIKLTEPVGVSSREFFKEVMKLEVTDEYIKSYDSTWGAVTGRPPLFKHYLRDLELIDGPCFSESDQFDVAAFRVREVHPAAGVVKLGVHWDDWVYRGLWHVSDAIILGYPPVPMVNQPVLVAARAEINTFVVPRHAPAVHFILSAMPRGGFSGGVAIHENGDALGVITSSFLRDEEPEQLGFFAVLSIEAIVKCLERNHLYPDVQRQHHDEVLGLGKRKS
jgi:hypothetical protein